MRTVVQEPKSQKLTHALVKRFNEMEPAPHDRPLRETRVRGLQKLVENGEFRTCEWCSAFCKETGKEHRINGKHTSSMFATMNGDLPSFNLLVSKYECDTLEDVAKLYSSFDTRQSARTSNDIYRIYAASNEELAALPSSLVNLAIAGISFSDHPDTQGGGKNTADERAERLLEHPSFAVWLFDLVGSNTKCNLRRGPVVGAMFKTYQKSQKDSTDFWSMVRDGSGTNHVAPDRLLSRYLDTTSISSGRGAMTGKKKVTAREMYVRSLHAWNAWRKGEKTELKYYSQSKIPTVV